jgi:hypothetical protein
VKVAALVMTSITFHTQQKVKLELPMALGFFFFFFF